MTEVIDWEQFAGAGGAFVKWEKHGDTIKGTIAAVTVGRDMNENKVPQIDVDTADGVKTLTCSQAQLRAKISALRPKIGDTLEVTYTHDEAAALGKKKCFDVKVTPGDKAPF